jgi:peptidoglycan DL-endopeptidase CwlO
MSTISYNLAQLENLRATTSPGAGRVATVGEGLQDSGSAAIFGANSEAGAIWSAVEATTSHLRTEFAKGGALLRGVSRAVDAVQTSIEDADRVGTRLFQTTPASASGGGGGGAGGGTAVAAANPNVGTAPPVTFGTGGQVTLPDATTVEAPNEKAAGAVREALTQLGVPYVWGADTPGKGFDCSGLTSWAYGQEGVSLDHYAANQDVGERVSMANLAPGDLAVWDGHVAMIIGLVTRGAGRACRAVA